MPSPPDRSEPRATTATGPWVAVLTIVLVAALTGCAAGGAPAPEPPTPTRTTPPTPPPTVRAREAPRPAPTVVLDAGHNGGNARAADAIARDVPDGRGGTKPCNTTGTQTADGYAEHAFTADVVDRVARMLTAHGVVVRTTRPDDAGVGPCVDRRAAIANDAGATLTVSVHADSAPAGGRGFHVATSAPALAASQRAPSADLARALAASMTAGGFIPSTYRGHDGLDPRDDLAGLNLARVPAALVECGNMANAGEARLMETPEGRERYAAALATGILRALG